MAPGQTIIGARQAGKFGIGRRQDDDVARILPEIDGLVVAAEMPDWVASRCTDEPSGRQRGGDGVAVEALEADDDEIARRGLAVAPGTVEIVIEARADGLHQQPRGASSTARNPFRRNTSWLAIRPGMRAR